MKYLLLVVGLFFTLSTNGQNKIKIYLKIEIDSNCFRKQKFYSETEKGYIINPNCNSGGNFIYQTKSDTLSLINLKKFKITTAEEIKKIEKKWREQKFIEYKKSKEKYPLPIHTFDKNYIFETYLIEIISENKFVVYPVKWRGEGIRQCTSIQNLDNPDNFPALGVYYKDLNNILNDFVGTWKYSKDDNLFEIILEKKFMSSLNGYYYMDMLIGSYRYVENGIEKVNVINTHDVSFPDGYSNPIMASFILTGKSRGCDLCGINEKWIIGGIRDPVSQTISNIFIRKSTHYEQEALKITIHYGEAVGVTADAPERTPISFPPAVEFILIKQ